MRNVKYMTRLSAVLILGLFLSTACSEDEDPQPSISADKTTIDFGDVQAGASATAEVVVTGADITGTLDVVVSGEGFSVDKSQFIIANASNTITVTFAPAEEAAVGAATGEIIVSSGDLSVSINLTANVTEKPQEGFEAGTVIYANDFEFGLSHQDPVTATTLDGTSTAHEEVSITHVVTDDEANGPYVKVQGQFAMCSESIDGDKANADNNDESDGFCGNGFTVQAPGNSVAIKASGLVPGTTYTAIYWIRPNASSERGLDASITGATPVSHVFNETNANNDNTIYTRFKLVGQADANGELEFKLESTLPVDSSTKAMSIDNVSIVAGNE